MFSLSRWSARRLLVAWGGYWIGLGLVALGPPAYELWTLTTGHAGKVAATAGLEDAIINVSVLRDGAAAWTGSISVAMLALWVAGPPLVMWLLWLFGQSASPHGGTGLRGSASNALDRGDQPGAMVPGQSRETVLRGERSEGAVSPRR